MAEINFRKIPQESETFTAVVQADKSGQPYVMIGSRKYAMNHGSYNGLEAGQKVSIKLKGSKFRVLSGYGGEPAGQDASFPPIRGTLYPFGKEKSYKEMKKQLREREDEKEFKAALTEIGLA